MTFHISKLFESEQENNCEQFFRSDNSNRQNISAVANILPEY